MDEQKPSLNDSRWNQNTESAPEGLKWVIWNYGGGRRVVGTLKRRFSRYDDAEAWMPMESASAS